MADLAHGDIILTTIRSTLFGQTVLSTFGWLTDTGGGNVNYEAAMDGLNSQLSLGNRLYERYYAACPAQVLGYQFWHQAIKPLRLYRRVYPNTLVGTYAGVAAYTANVAAAITRRGDAGVRKDVSTLHMPAPESNAAIDQGALTQAYKALLQDLADEMKVDAVVVAPAVTFHPIVIQKGVATNYKKIIQTVVQPTVRVMRRRTVGKGE